MRMVNLAALAVVAILAAGPALAGERGGGHPGGGCGSRCGGGGGGHRPPPPPGGGFNSNINVNVNANANANANAFAGASAGSYFNARAYDVGGIRGRGYGGGSVYVGGGYGGDGGGYFGGGAVYNEEIYEGRACASAPFGYVVEGFGRNERRAPACVAEAPVCRDRADRGGRYGYSVRRGCDGGRYEERYGAHDRSRSSYDSYESYEEYGYREERYDYDRHRGHGYERREDHRPHVRSRQGAPVYVEAPPVYVQQPDVYVPAPPPIQAAPMTPNEYYGIGEDGPPPPRPPRQYYSQEPGERG